jgi:polyisoprenoid-binding protein YceI
MTMKRFSILAAVFALFTTFASAQANTWTVDSAHSNVEFSVKHLGISNVHGRFGKVAGTIVYDATDVTKSSVNVTIDVAGLDTGMEPRDNHLKTDSFFDTAKIPTASFASTSVVKDGSGLKVTGNLTLHGVTKPVVLNVDAPASAIGMDKKPHSGFSATATINRLDFNVGSTFPDAVVSNTVKLTIEVEAVQK